MIEAAFRAAPEDILAGELAKLRMVTRGRDDRSISGDDQEAELLTWMELLRCWPGDIAVDALRSWPKTKNGQFWPTWHELQKQLEQRRDKRMALANYVHREIENGKNLVKNVERAMEKKAQEEQAQAGITDDERAAAVDKAWTNGLRREWYPPDTISEAECEKRIKAQQITVENPLLIGQGLGKYLDEMKRELETGETSNKPKMF